MRNREPADITDELVDRISNAVIAKLTSQGLREPAFQAGCRGFESRLPLQIASKSNKFDRFFYSSLPVQKAGCRKR